MQLNKITRELEEWAKGEKERERKKEKIKLRPRSSSKSFEESAIHIFARGKSQLGLVRSGRNSYCNSDTDTDLGLFRVGVTADCHILEL
jgi:hypothetical protein